MRFIVAFSFLLSLGCIRHLPPEQSCGYIMSKKDRRVSWGRYTPVKIELHTSVPSEARESILRAVNTWNKVAGYELLKISKTGSRASLGATGENAIFWYSGAWPNQEKEQAVTSLEWAGSILIDADIKINAYGFKMAYNDSQLNRSTVDLESLVLHELGYLLGLSHKEDESSVMHHSLAKGEIRRTPSENDVYSIRCEY